MWMLMMNQPLFLPQQLAPIQTNIQPIQMIQNREPSLEQPSPVVERPVEVQQSEEPAEEVYFEKENFRVFRKLIGEGTYSKVWEGVNLITK